MIIQPQVTSDSGKQRKVRHTADSAKRAKLMCAPLSKELKQKYGGVKSMPIRKDDRVRVVRGGKKETEGKVVRVYRKNYVIHIERMTKDKANQQTVPIPIDPSNVVITQLKMDKNRKEKLEAKLKGRNDARAKKGLETAVASSD